MKVYLAVEVPVLCEIVVEADSVEAAIAKAQRIDIFSIGDGVRYETEPKEEWFINRRSVVDPDDAERHPGRGDLTDLWVNDEQRDDFGEIGHLLDEYKLLPALCGDGSPVDPSAPYPAGE